MTLRRLWWAVLIGSALEILLCAYAYSLHASPVFVVLAGVFAAFCVRAIGVLRKTRRKGIRA